MEYLYYNEAVTLEEESDAQLMTKARLLLRTIAREQQYKSQIIILLLFALLSMFAISRVKSSLDIAFHDIVSTNFTNSIDNVKLDTSTSLDTGILFMSCHLLM